MVNAVGVRRIAVPVPLERQDASVKVWASVLVDEQLLALQHSIGDVVAVPVVPSGRGVDAGAPERGDEVKGRWVGPSVVDAARRLPPNLNGVAVGVALRLVVVVPVILVRDDELAVVVALDIEGNGDARFAVVGTNPATLPPGVEVGVGPTRVDEALGGRPFSVNHPLLECAAELGAERPYLLVRERRVVVNEKPLGVRPPAVVQPLLDPINRFGRVAICPHRPGRLALPRERHIKEILGHRRNFLGQDGVDVVVGAQPVLVARFCARNDDDFGAANLERANIGAVVRRWEAVPVGVLADERDDLTPEELKVGTDEQVTPTIATGTVGKQVGQPKRLAAVGRAPGKAAVPKVKCLLC